MFWPNCRTIFRQSFEHLFKDQLEDGPNIDQTWHPSTFLLGLGQKGLWKRVVDRWNETRYRRSFLSRKFRGDEVYMGWVSYLLDVSSTTRQYIETERLHLYELTFRPTFLSCLSMRIIMTKVKRINQKLISGICPKSCPKSYAGGSVCYW
jgi:hypothetical protein